MAYSSFLQILGQAAKKFGTEIICVPRYYPSSKTCSVCGAVKEMGLGDRVYSCPVCGHIEDRDLNAAKNILAEGLRMKGVGASPAQ